MRLLLRRATRAMGQQPVWMVIALYAVVAVIWLYPDQRFERLLQK